MPIEANRTVGELAVEYPRATRVFARHNIDYCCGGTRPLRDACAARQLDTDTVLGEIRRELAGADAGDRRWDDAALAELIDHILSTYHRPLAEELPRLEEMTRKVYDAHRDTAEPMLSELRSIYRGLKDELEGHMLKEEQILFPMIRQGESSAADGPIACMEEEHEHAGAALARLRTLTNGYQVPAEACATWRALWHGLSELEQALHEHIHLENNILFPRALRSAS